MMMKVSLIFFVIGLSYVYSHPLNTSKEKRLLIQTELYAFISTIGEKSLLEFHKYHLETGKEQGDCFSTPGGQLMRSRCCVFYSSIISSLLYIKYTSPEFDFTTLSPSSIDWLMRLWAIQNEERDGIYSVSLTIAGVQGTLMRCEFLTVHTYLLFVSEELDTDILIDVSYIQFLVFPDYITDQKLYYKLSDLTKDVDPVFVGSKEEFFKSFNSDRLWTYTHLLLEDKSLFGPFTKSYESLHILFGDWAKQNICGKPTSKYHPEKGEL